MARFKNADWDIRTEDEIRPKVHEDAILAVLMDIRDEMQRLNTLLHCPNFVGIPGKLERIARKLPSRRKR